jgi:hypothetical protein
MRPPRRAGVTGAVGAAVPTVAVRLVPAAADTVAGLGGPAESPPQAVRSSVQVARATEAGRDIERNMKEGSRGSRSDVASEETIGVLAVSKVGLKDSGKTVRQHTPPPS